MSSDNQVRRQSTIRRIFGRIHTWRSACRRKFFGRLGRSSISALIVPAVVTRSRGESDECEIKEKLWPGVAAGMLKIIWICWFSMENSMQGVHVFKLFNWRWLIKLCACNWPVQLSIGRQAIIDVWRRSFTLGRHLALKRVKVTGKRWQRQQFFNQTVCTWRHSWRTFFFIIITAPNWALRGETLLFMFQRNKWKLVFLSPIPNSWRRSRESRVGVADFSTHSSLSRRYPKNFRAFRWRRRCWARRKH